MVKIILDPIEKNRINNLDYKLAGKIREVLNFYKWAVENKKTSAVFIIDGRSGMGKSTLAGQMGSYCDKNFSIDNFHFDPEEFLTALAKAKKGDFILFDEAMLVNSRSALTQINRMIIIAMSMIRSKQIFVCFCVNSIFDLDRNLALSRADILFNVYGMHLADRGSVMTFFKGSDNRDRLKELYLKGKKFYSYAHPKSNFNTHFSSRFVVNEKIYDEKKDKAVDKFLLNTTTKIHNKDREARDKLVLWLIENIKKVKNIKITQKKIAEISGVTPRTITNIIAKQHQKEQGNNKEGLY